MQGDVAAGVKPPPVPERWAPANRQPRQRQRKRGGRAATAAGGLPTLTPLYKTQMCDFWLVGKCQKGSACPYAHGDADLRPSPDFERTSVCPAFLKDGQCNRPGCRYAHDVSELRVAPGLLKSKMCSFFMNGHCVVGEACRFAHCEEELLDAGAVLTEVAAAGKQPELAQHSEGSIVKAKAVDPSEETSEPASQLAQAHGSMKQVIKIWPEMQKEERALEILQPAKVEPQRQDAEKEDGQTKAAKKEVGLIKAMSSQSLTEESPLPQQSGSKLEPMKVVIAASWAEDLQDDVEDVVSSLKTRSCPAQELPKNSAARRSRARRVLVDTLADLDELQVAATSSVAVASQTANSGGCVVVNGSPGLMDLSARQRQPVVVLDIEEAQEICKGCDKFLRPRSQAQSGLVEIRRPKSNPQRRPAESGGTARPKAPEGAARPCSGAASSCAADADSPPTSWCRLGYGVRCDAPAPACALCTQDECGAEPGRKCAACNSGVRVIQRNTFLTVADDEDEDDIEPVPFRRTKSL